ncbi:hypothetical protein NMG60_11017632 [Bertholletia excelsa]
MGVDEGRRKQSEPEEGKAEFQRHIPEDIIILILSKVPVDSLLCFRRVSKSWHSLIPDLSVQTHKAVFFNYEFATEGRMHFTTRSIDDYGLIKYLRLPEPSSQIDQLKTLGILR